MPFHRAHFGMGSGPILLGSAHCTGMESSVLECRLNVNNLLSCNHYEDAGVQCQGTVIQLCESKIENHPWCAKIPSYVILKKWSFNTRKLIIIATYLWPCHKVNPKQSVIQLPRNNLEHTGNMWNCFLSKCMILLCTIHVTCFHCECLNAFSM